MSIEYRARLRNFVEGEGGDKQRAAVAKRSGEGGHYMLYASSGRPGRLERGMNEEYPTGSYAEGGQLPCSFDDL